MISFENQVKTRGCYSLSGKTIATNRKAGAQTTNFLAA
jgi:hypothetical protein